MMPTKPPESGTDPEFPDLTGTHVFPHPEWALGVVLIIAVVMLLLGVLGHPLWLLIGSPFILTLLVWLGVRITQRRRRRIENRDPEAQRTYTGAVGRDQDKNLP